MPAVLVFLDDDADFSKATMNHTAQHLKRKAGKSSCINMETELSDDSYLEERPCKKKKTLRTKVSKKGSSQEARSYNSKCDDLPVQTGIIATSSVDRDEETSDSHDSGISTGSERAASPQGSTCGAVKSKAGKEKARKKKLNSRLKRLLDAKRKNSSSSGKSSDTVTEPVLASCKVFSGCCKSSDGMRPAYETQSGCKNCDTNSTRPLATKPNSSIAKKASLPDKSQIVALDCEFVGAGPSRRNALGRCSIVDMSGKVLCDIYAKPEERITDYRTPWSGIRKRDMKRAVPFESAQNLVRNLIKDKVVIGHAVYNDFQVLGIHHPARLVRDTAKYSGLRTLAKLPPGNGPSLKNLTYHLLGRRIQNGEHCSVEDARATMDLYRLVHTSWERELMESPQKRESRNIAWGEHPDSFLDDAYWPDDILD